MLALVHKYASMYIYVLTALCSARSEPGFTKSFSRLLLGDAAVVADVDALAADLLLGEAAATGEGVAVSGLCPAVAIAVSCLSLPSLLLLSSDGCTHARKHRNRKNAGAVRPLNL